LEGITIIALVKLTDATDIILEPFPAWLDPVAFSVFDCYGYAYCEDLTPKSDDSPFTEQDFEFGTEEIPNPYKQSKDDPDTVLRHIARQIL